MYAYEKKDPYTFSFTSADELRLYIQNNGLNIPFSTDLSPLAAKKELRTRGGHITLQNSLTVHPMEGFDGRLTVRAFPQTVSALCPLGRGAHLVGGDRRPAGSPHLRLPDHDYGEKRGRLQSPYFGYEKNLGCAGHRTADAFRPILQKQRNASSAFRNEKPAV